MPLEKAEALKESFEKQTYWYDIYAGKKKIGFANTVFEKAGDEMIIRHEREMNAVKAGKNTVLYDRLRCLSDLSFSIKSFEYSSHFKDETGIKLTGKVDSGEVIFSLESAEKRRTHKTPLNGRGFFLPITFIRALVQKNPIPNTTHTVPLLDFGSLAVKDVNVTVEEIRPIKIGVNILSLYKFKTGNAILWSNEKGVIVKEEYPSGITIYSQVEKFAIDPADRILFDYTKLPVLKSEKLIPDPDKLNILKLRIKGYSLDPQVYKDSTISLENDILIIKKKDISHLKDNTYTLPFTENGFSSYLSPDEWVLSKYKPLEDTGRIYAKGYKNDAFKFTQYLNGYLFQLIKTRPMFVLQNSKDFLDSLFGDYLERTIMFASYSRAAGLPTRLVGGLVYLNGYFYFHTWPEVWFDKWVPIDPTLAQFPADVTHIPLKEGSLKDIISITDKLRDIKIETIEMEE